MIWKTYVYTGICHGMSSDQNHDWILLGRYPAASPVDEDLASNSTHFPPMRGREKYIDPIDNYKLEKAMQTTRNEFNSLPVVTRQPGFRPGDS